MTRNIKTVMACCAALALVPVQALAAVVTFDSFDSGWYSSAGQHSPSNANIFTGKSGSLQYRSFFAFDITGAREAESISITFRPQGTLRTNAGTETAWLFDYTGNVGSLVGGSGGVAAYNDLGSGAVLGMRTVTGANGSAMPEITIELGLDFVAQFNALRQSADPRIALGAALQSIQQSSIEAFWFGSGNVPAAVLTVREREVRPDPAPEPMSLALLGAGLFGIGAATRRQRKAG